MGERYTIELSISINISLLWLGGELYSCINIFILLYSNRCKVELVENLMKTNPPCDVNRQVKLQKTNGEICSHELLLYFYYKGASLPCCKSNSSDSQPRTCCSILIDIAKDRSYLNDYFGHQVMNPINIRCKCQHCIYSGQIHGELQKHPSQVIV